MRKHDTGFDIPHIAPYVVLERFKLGETVERISWETWLPIEEIQATIQFVQDSLPPSSLTEINYELLLDAASGFDTADL